MHYGQTGRAGARADFVGDGTVNINDLTIVLANYGETSGSSNGGMAAVPEPAAVALFGRRREPARARPATEKMRLKRQLLGLGQMDQFGRFPLAPAFPSLPIVLLYPLAVPATMYWG